MKKIMLSLSVIFLLVSCQEDIKFNNPALQGVKDNVFWRSTQSKATLSGDGSLLIKGYTSTETVSLKTASTKVQTYILGTGVTNKASYEHKEGTTTTTFSTAGGIGNGEIVITEYDVVTKTVSGTFKFNAENSDKNSAAGTNLNFQQGVFYKVPVSPSAQ